MALQQRTSWLGNVPGSYVSYMHGECTRIEIFSRVEDPKAMRADLGRMTLFLNRTGSLELRRDPADVRERSDRMYTFVMMIDGEVTFSHYGYQTKLSAGDITLCDNSSVYDLKFEGPAEFMFFRVPLDLVEVSFPSPDCVCGQRLAADRPFVSTAFAMARDFLREEFDNAEPEALERAGQHLLNMLASAYVGMVDQFNSASALMAGRLWRVKLHIERNLRDPELCPSLIAKQMRLSDRYLRMIFGISDESPSTYILRRRLEECASQLRDKRWRNRSITELAFGWGFNSAPHFARTFRARFGQSPREYRQAHLERDDADHLAEAAE